MHVGVENNGYKPVAIVLDKEHEFDALVTILTGHIRDYENSGVRGEAVELRNRLLATQKQMANNER